MKVLLGGEQIVRVVTRLPQQQQIAAWTDDTLFIWNNAGELVQTLPAPHDGYEHADLSISPNGEWLAGYGGNSIQYWRLVKGEWQLNSEEVISGLCLARFTAAPALLTIVSLSAAKRGSVAIRVVKRSLANRRTISKDLDIATFPIEPWHIESASDFPDVPFRLAHFSQDGRWLMLSAREPNVFVWDAVSGRFVGSIHHRSFPTEGRFSNDGSMFADFAGANVSIFQTQDLKQLTAFKGKFSYAQIAWSPDDRLVARVDGTATVRVYDVANRREVTALALKGHRGTAVNFSPDGLTLLVGTIKGPVVVWDIDE